METERIIRLILEWRRVLISFAGTNDLIQYYLVIDRSDQSVVAPVQSLPSCHSPLPASGVPLLRPTGKPITVMW